MRNLSDASCTDCYFRCAGLCALPGDVPCPTFRLAKTALAPPQQPQLVPLAPPRAAFATA